MQTLAEAFQRGPSAEEMRARQEAIRPDRRTVPVPDDPTKAEELAAEVSSEPETKVEE
jgi:hypothetical protein